MTARSSAANRVQFFFQTWATTIRVPSHALRLHRHASRSPMSSVRNAEMSTEHRTLLAIALVAKGGARSASRVHQAVLAPIRHRAARTRPFSDHWRLRPLFPPRLARCALPSIGRAMAEHLRMFPLRASCLRPLTAQYANFPLRPGKRLDSPESTWVICWPIAATLNGSASRNRAEEVFAQYLACLARAAMTWDKM